MRLLKNRRRSVLAVAALVAVALVCGLAGLTVSIGGREEFCSGSCHEMAPLTAGLQSAVHRGVPCLDCHGEQGTWHVIAQKLAAIRSLVTHLGGGGLPSGVRADVPDERCRRCHRGPSMPTLVTLGTVAFRHESHAGRDGTRCVTSSLPSHRGVPHIDGKGRPLPCSRCHTSGYATAGCACHSGARHRPQALSGAHAATACARCHVSGYGSLPGGCSSCHRSPHGGPVDCARCHDTSSWTAHFSHRRVAPHIPAGSPALACVDCHRSTYSRSSCSCHATPAPSPTSSPSPASDSSPDPAPVSSPSPPAGESPGARFGGDSRSAAR